MSGMTCCSLEDVFSLSGTIKERRRHLTKPQTGVKRWRHNKVLQICSWQDGRNRRKSHSLTWTKPSTDQCYPAVRQPWFLALPDFSFFSPKFMQGLLDLSCAGTWCLDSVGVRNNSLKWLKMPQMQAMLQSKPTTAAEVCCFPCREPREFISASNVFFPLQKSGGDNTTKVLESMWTLFSHCGLVFTFQRRNEPRDSKMWTHNIMKPLKIISVSLSNLAFS